MDIITPGQHARRNQGQLLERAMRRFSNQLPVCSPADVDTLLDGVFQHSELEELQQQVAGIIDSLTNFAPVISGYSHIGCTVEGPVVVHNVQLRNGGVIAGCGALLMAEITRVPDGSIILLRGGQIITSAADLRGVTVGTIYDPDSSSMN